MKDIIFYQYFERAQKFQSMINSMAISIDYLLNCIIEELKIPVSKNSLLGVKIGKLEESKNIWGTKYKSDSNKLIDGLKEFDINQNIIKNGMIVMEENDLTYRTNEECYSFNRQKQEEAVHEFTFIMRELTQIQEAL